MKYEMGTTYNMIDKVVLKARRDEVPQKDSRYYSIDYIESVNIKDILQQNLLIF